MKRTGGKTVKSVVRMADREVLYDIQKTVNEIQVDLAVVKSESKSQTEKLDTQLNNCRDTTNVLFKRCETLNTKIESNTEFKNTMKGAIKGLSILSLVAAALAIMAYFRH